MSTLVGTRPLITLGRRVGLTAVNLASPEDRRGEVAAGLIFTAIVASLALTVLVLLTRERAHGGPGDPP